MKLNDETDLIARHMPRGQSIEEELALFFKQPMDKRETIATRLEVLDSFLKLSKASAQDADLAAATIGVARKQFYRLVVKLKELGPVRGLCPGFRNVERASVVRDGLGEPIEQILVDYLRENSRETIAQIESYMRCACAAHGLDAPKETSLRKRIHAIRRAGLFGAPQLDFGTELVVDQTVIDLPIGNERGSRLGTVTMIVDAGTRLICGVGLTDESYEAEGLSAALADASMRLGGFARARLDPASRLLRLTWVVPPDVTEVEQAALGERTKSRFGIEVDIMATGSRRHGTHLMRLLGDRLGPYAFRLRGASQPEWTRDAGIDIVMARHAIGRSVDHWNARVIDQLGGYGESNRAHDRRLRRLLTQLQMLFAPVIGAAYHRYDWLEAAAADRYKD